MIEADGDEDFPEITEDEIARYEELRKLLNGDYENARPAMLRCKLDDVPVAILVAVVAGDAEQNGEAGQFVELVAIMLDSDLIERVTVPGGYSPSHTG